jgi:ABC-type sugar transport system permease subunit
MKAYSQFDFNAMGLPSKKAIEKFYETNPLGWVILPERLAEFEEAIRFGNYKKIFNFLRVEKRVGYFSWFSGDKAVQSYANAGFIKLSINTLLYAGFTTFAHVFVCYTTAYVTAKYKFKWSGVMYGFVVFSIGVPLIGSQPAMVNTLQKFNLFSNWVGLFCMTATYGGMYYLVFFAFFESLPDSYIEAAEIDGATGVNAFFNITIPLLSPTIFFVVVTRVISAMQVFDLIFMVIEKSNPAFEKVQSLVYLFYNYSFEQMNIGYGSTIVVVLLLVIMILTVFQMYGQKKWVFYN